MDTQIESYNSRETISGNIMKEEIHITDSNAANIKIEPLEELYEDSEKKLKVKCGEVFALFAERLILVCSFCKTPFNDMHILGHHLFQQHKREFFTRDEEYTLPKRTEVIMLQEDFTKDEDYTLPKRTEMIMLQEAAMESFVPEIENAVKHETSDISNENSQNIPVKIGFRCDICGFILKTPKSLRRHKTSSRCNPPNLIADGLTGVFYNCTKCGFLFKNRRNYVRHVSRSACGRGGRLEPRKPAIEVLSGDIKDSLSTLFGNREASPSQQNDNTNSIFDEDLKFSDLSDDNPEPPIRRRYPAKPDPNLQCKICNKYLSSRRVLDNHSRMHILKDHISESNPDGGSGPPKQPLHVCGVCKLQFRSKVELYFHLDSHDTVPPDVEGDREYLKCKYCLQKFNKYAERVAHEGAHFGPRPYECPICHKGFATNISRRSHIRVHTGESPFQCDRCKKVFRDKHDLARHVVRHFDIRNFPCNLCEKKFYNKHALQLHMRSHTKERPYVCEDCGKTFVVSQQLKDHQLRHTGVKNVKCEICERLFYSKSVLKIHMASHSDEKPFECTVCGRRFSRAKAMQKHMRLHSGIKKYVCNICGKAYAQDSGLYAHKKTHSKVS